MLRACWLAGGLALAGCPTGDVTPPVVDVPMGYTGPVTLEIESHAAGVVVSTPSGIYCPKTCSADFPMGTAIHIELTQQHNYFLALFGKPCEKEDNDAFACDVTITGPIRIVVDGGQE